MSRRATGWRLSVMALPAALGLSACGDDGGGSFSSNDSSRSHRHGEDCARCHRPGGDGDGVFTISGSTFRSDGETAATGGVIEILSPTDHGVLARIEVDRRGNFYTDADIDLASGVLAVFLTAGNAEVTKPTAVTSGACSSCHGRSTEVIAEP